MLDSEQVRAGEVPFGLDGIFYSRTDPRGVISSCNPVFCRVANHPESKLVGAPHRIIRHPDMPRGVFQLFWERLQSSRPVGAYVKNRSSDGRHYWVLATARPFGGGHVPVRIKPSSPLRGGPGRHHAPARGTPRLDPDADRNAAAAGQGARAARDAGGRVAESVR